MKHKDFRGAAYNQLRKLKLRLISGYWTFLIRIRFKLIGVKFQKPIKFYGNSFFVRHRYSNICIGKNCSFTSTSYVNVAGVNKKNTISTINKGAKLTIGDRCGFSGAVICVAKEVTIGENVLVGTNCFISDYGFHELNPDIRWSGKLSSTIADPVHIGNNVWLGMNVVVLKGVTIGENSIIGANSLVTKDIPDNVIAAGNPCVIKKELDFKNEKQ